MPPAVIRKSALLLVGKIAGPASVLALVIAACGSGGSHTVPPSTKQGSGSSTTTTQPVPVNPGAASFGQQFRLGRLTIVIADGGTLPDPTPGAAPRRRLVVKIQNASGVPDRAPGLAVTCAEQLQLSGGSLYADPHPAPRAFVAGKTEPAGASDAASLTVALNPECSKPVLQVSTGGATINGLPRPVLMPMK